MHEKHVRQNNGYRVRHGRDPIQYKSVKIVQVKSKFGTLRFYIDGGDEYVRGAIAVAGANNLPDPEHQKEDSIKIKELYEWWTKTRPNRLDPMDSITEETHGQYYFRLIDEIEQDYNKEDTEKLIELIKIRGSLWT